MATSEHTVGPDVDDTTRDGGRPLVIGLAIALVLCLLLAVGLGYLAWLAWLVVHHLPTE